MKIVTKYYENEWALWCTDHEKFTFYHTSE